MSVEDSERKSQPLFVAVDRPRDGVARLTLNRPERRNALLPAMLDELDRELTLLDADPKVGCIVLRGAGKSFCAGADLITVYGPASVRPDMGAHPIWDHLEHCRNPVVAAVHGHAVTGGFLLALCCDVIIAASGTLFQDTHARWGLAPTGGETSRYPRRLGLFKARELMLTSRPLTAEDAWRLGVVAEVVAPELLEDAALTIASEIAGQNRRSVRLVKAMLNRGSELDYVGSRLVDGFATDWGHANHAPDADRDARLGQFSSKRRPAPQASTPIEPST